MINVSYHNLYILQFSIVMEKYNMSAKLRGRSALRYESTNKKRIHDLSTSFAKSFYSNYLNKPQPQ